MKTSTCDRCKRTIVWCVTPEGKKIPLDPDPSPAGKVWCSIERGVVVGRVASKANPRPPGKPFVAHFITCTSKPTTTTKPPAKAAPEPPPSLF